MRRQPIKSLRNDCITTKPVECDWSEGYGETWEYHTTAECGECGKVVFGVRGEDRHCDIDSDSECTGYLNADGPMMNYFYALPEFARLHDIEDAAKAIAHLPLCIVEFTGGNHDGYALALTGGGMNLAWEICEAFMCLGYLPPVHFAGLPAMCGRGVGSRDMWIMGACRKSARVASVWALNCLRDINHARDFGRQYDKTYQAKKAAQKAETHQTT